MLDAMNIWRTYIHAYAIKVCKLIAVVNGERMYFVKPAHPQARQLIVANHLPRWFTTGLGILLSRSMPTERVAIPAPYFPPRIDTFGYI